MWCDETKIITSRDNFEEIPSLADISASLHLQSWPGWPAMTLVPRWSHNDSVQSFLPCQPAIHDNLYEPCCSCAPSLKLDQPWLQSLWATSRSSGKAPRLKAMLFPDFLQEVPSVLLAELYRLVWYGMAHTSADNLGNQEWKCSPVATCNIGTEWLCWPPNIGTACWFHFISALGSNE